MSEPLTVEDFRPCECGHPRRLHNSPHGCNGQLGNGQWCTCARFDPAEELYIDIPHPANQPPYVFGMNCAIVPLPWCDEMNTALRIRGSDIAYANYITDYYAKHYTPSSE